MKYEVTVRQRSELIVLSAHQKDQLKIKVLQAILILPSIAICRQEQTSDDTVH